MLAKLRFERNWTQETLTAKLQCLGVNISRDMLASMESGRTRVPDELIVSLHRVFKVRIIRLFPRSVQELDEKFAERDGHEAHPIKH